MYKHMTNDTHGYCFYCGKPLTQDNINPGINESTHVKCDHCGYKYNIYDDIDMEKEREEDIDHKFQDLIRNKMTESQFWHWVASWYDAEEIINIALDWDTGAKADTLEEFEYLIK